MTNAAGNPPSDSAYVAHLWDFPQLTIALFGLQFHSPEAYQMYEQAGIPTQIRADVATTEGMLCMREFPEGNGGVLMQYWRSHEDLASYAKRMPHMSWWKWLMDNDGKGLSFYHEIYQCKSAEAIFERGTAAVGPGAFCETSPTELGGNRSVERQRRFDEAARA
ncbi:MAG TPA: DUF4188 domain-containing protein [Dehalococcoidia bacterium]|jgi:hypothetical protein|nr:DUF4188 domain-containing protein [Dehalococcoidia bacterium]